MREHGIEIPKTFTSSRRRLIQLGTLSAGGLILGATAASASAPIVAAPGEDGNFPTTGTSTRSSAGTKTTAADAPVGSVSYNGWPVSATASAISVQTYTVANTTIKLQLRSGDVAWILMYVANRFQAEVQPLKGYQCGGWEYRANVNNTKTWSCHASGTAIDLNWEMHPNTKRGTFTAAQVVKIRKILSDCNGVVGWGADFRTPDEMHFEINPPPGHPSLAALVAKIRGTASTPVPPKPVPPVVPRTIALRAGINGRYVTAEARGAAALIANRTSIGLWERFDVIAVNATQVALRAHANGRFVCAEKAGALPLIASRTVVGRWETFTIVPQADGTIALRAAVNGRYVTAEQRGALPLIANRTTVGPWEKFRLQG